MTKPEFERKWQGRLTMMAMTGLALDTEERAKGILTAQVKAFAYVNTIPALIAEMWNDLQPEANGKAHPAHAPAGPMRK